MLLCDECAAVKIGQTTVGRLIEEGIDFYKEGARKDDLKLLLSLEKYREALKALEDNNGHANCVAYVAKEYTRIYRIMQGSRA